MKSDPKENLEQLGDWSEWVPFSIALTTAPTLPGVYMAREGKAGPIVYVGMAGERMGSRGRPQGIRGRLKRYASGKALTSGLGEAVADRAFADLDWLRERTAEVERGEPKRAADWGKEAFARADLHLRWIVANDGTMARSLEIQCGRMLEGSVLWNRAKFNRGL